MAKSLRKGKDLRHRLTNCDTTTGIQGKDRDEIRIMTTREESDLGGVLGTAVAAVEDANMLDPAEASSNRMLGGLSKIEAANEKTDLFGAERKTPKLICINQNLGTEHFDETMSQNATSQSNGELSTQDIPALKSAGRGTHLLPSSWTHDLGAIYLLVSQASKLIDHVSSYENVINKEACIQHYAHDWAKQLHGDFNSLLEHGKDEQIQSVQLISAFVMAGVFEAMMKLSVPAIVSGQSRLLRQYRELISDECKWEDSDFARYN